ncbi:MAG: hypothetical protein ACM3YF_05865 [Candidatus Zixiibacteriota bacterium]
MRRREASLAVFVLAAIIVPHGLSAQVRVPEKPICLEQVAQKIRPGSKIILIQPDGKWIKGRFETVDLGQSLLTLSSLTKPDAPPRFFQVSEISRIEYRKAGKLNPLWMGVGLAVGGLGGYLIGKTGSTQSDAFNLGHVFGVFGGGIGLLAGTIVPLAIPSDRTIACK